MGVTSKRDYLRPERMTSGASKTNWWNGSASWLLILRALVCNWGLAQAVARLRHPDLVAPLNKLLKEDLRRWAIAKQESREARARGQPRLSDAGISYVLQYAQAFSAIGNPAVADLMAGLLADPEFGVQAALVLKQISNKDQPAEAQRPLGSAWPDFSKVAAARAKREQGGQSTAATTEPIFKAIDQLCGDTSQSAHRRGSRTRLRCAFNASCRQGRHH